MDNPNSGWIFAAPYSKSKYFWILLNINNNRGSLAIANDLPIASYFPLVFLYFTTKIGNKY